MQVNFPSGGFSNGDCSTCISALDGHMFTCPQCVGAYGSGTCPSGIDVCEWDLEMNWCPFHGSGGLTVGFSIIAHRIVLSVFLFAPRTSAEAGWTLDLGPDTTPVPCNTSWTVPLTSFPGFSCSAYPATVQVTAV
jgi:hypothetical protein